MQTVRDAIPCGRTGIQAVRRPEPVPDRGLCEAAGSTGRAGSRAGHRSVHDEAGVPWAPGDTETRNSPR